MSTVQAPRPPLAMVTGASRGIGADATRELVAAGFRVIAAARSLEPLQALATELDAVTPLQLDLNATDTIVPAMQAIEAEHGPVEVLVNNAGYGVRAAIEESDPEMVRKMFEVNLVGLLAITQAVLPGMRQRGRGRVIMVSSAAARVAPPVSGIYAATKAALRAASDALRREVKWLGIHVVQVEPGPVATTFSKSARGATEGLLTDESSPYRPVYRSYLEKIDHVNSSAVSSAAVARLIRKGATARRPRAVYAIHWIARFAPLLQAVLPVWLGDRLVGGSVRKAWAAARHTK